MGRLAAPALLLPLLLLASSCEPDEPPLGSSGCLLDADCVAGELCINSLCTATPDAGPIDAGPRFQACTPDTEAADCGPGSFCNGDGACAALPACVDGDCPDGLQCNDNSGFCVRPPECEDCCTPGSCDDGRWCNGVEVCDTASGRCIGALPPCGDLVCDEATHTCACTDNDECDAPEVCIDGACGCEPDCTGKQCGDDGCGGSCGSCPDSDVCSDGTCECIPDCEGKACGSDGCDGTCGECTAPDACTDGACVCQPDCDGKQCGDDGCGGTCGDCTGADICSPNGQCGCVPQCTGKECGDDGCGGSCGDCGSGVCDADGQCGCVPDCAGNECGADGCGGSCGECGPHQACFSGTCANDGVVCDVLTDTIVQDAYQDRTGFLTVNFDAQYEWDSRPYRWLDNYPLDAPTGAVVTVDLASDEFDPVLYIYETSGACIRVGKDDDSGPGLASQLTLTVGGGDYHIVTTSFGELDDGRYTLSTRAELCGLSMTPAVYDACAPRVASGGCDWNPCADYGNAPEFCCITANCRSGYGVSGSTMTLQSSSAICGPF
jgi:hypothetical protein